MLPSLKKDNLSFDSKNITFTILNEIIASITKEEKIENKKKPTEFLFKNLVEVNEQPIIRQLKFIRKSTNEEYTLHHIKVHQQFLCNLCGYHASYNIIESLNLLKSRSLSTFYTLDQSQKFWKYVFETNKFLWNYGSNVGLSNSWPWTHHTTHFGDFERSFLKVCLAYNPKFNDAFKNELNFEIKFINLNFQFYNLLIEEYELENYQKEIDNFIKFSKKNHHKIIVFMLGICNHWVSLLVHKLNSEIEFIFFDSRNVDYLTWSEKQIEDDIDEKDQIRIKNGRVPSTGFKKMIGMQAIKDIQRTLDLIGNCILGNTTLMKYHNDRRLEILYSSFLSEIPYLNKEFNNMNYNEIFNLKNKNLITIFEALNNWLICNYGSMKSFFSNFHDKNDLDEEYNLKLLKFLDYFRYLYKFMKEEKIWTKFSSRYPYLVRPIKISSLFDFSNL